MLEKHFGKWQYSTLLSFLLFYGGFVLVDEFPHPFAYLFTSIFFSILCLIVYIIIQKKHRFESFWMVLIVMSLSSGMGLRAILLDPEYTFQISWDRIYVFFGILFVWTTLLRLAPYRKLISLFVVLGLITTAIIGLAGLETKPYGVEMMVLSIFYLPIAISTIVYVKSNHSLERIFSLAYFGSFLLVFLIGAIVLSEGEALAPVIEGVGEVAVEGVVELGVALTDASKSRKRM
ncbi:MAG: hypothetical protein U1C51_10115 [Candidatus Izemoplasmatales bacterium]|nr:hypothetical protein [bacterium]MDZ4197584.1 hypothetical protein [Candidatus Izemoplasmatales bacterium]